MLLFVLLLTSQAKLLQLTRDRFQSEVIRNGNTKVWVLLFYKPFCKRYKEYYQAVEQAIVLTNGTVEYAEINCQGDPTLCTTFHVSTFPSLVIRNRTSFEEFQMPPNPASIAKAALKMINSQGVEIVDDFWIDEFRSKPTAILFTKKQHVPGWFAALSRSIPSKQMRFGICNDEGLWSDYNITSSPTVVFYNETSTFTHEGMHRIRFLKESARAFLAGTESRAPVHADFFVNTELPEVCYDYTVSCVFSYEAFVDQKVDQVRLRFKNNPFRFFVGDDPLPFPDLKHGQFVIFNAKKMGMIVVNDVLELEAALDRVLDGGAKWSPIEKCEYIPEL